MTINYNKLTIGDRLVRVKGGIFSRHHAIYMGRDTHTNQHIVAENQTNHGVRYITLRQFLGEGRLVRVEYNHFSLMKQHLIFQRVNARLGRHYVFYDYNCEHFVNDVLEGRAHSPQLTIGALFGIGLVALWVGSSGE